jgi:hypothetical protein
VRVIPPATTVVVTLLRPAIRAALIAVLIAGIAEALNLLAIAWD